MRMKQWLYGGLLALLVAVPVYATTFYSDQITNSDQTVPPVLNSANTSNKIHAACWTYTTGAAGATPIIGEEIQLVKIPGGVRVIGGQWAQEAMGTGAKFDLGYSSSSTRYGAGYFVATANGFLHQPIATSIVHNFGTEVSTATTIIATVRGNSWNPAAKFYGCLYYLQS